MLIYLGGSGSSIACDIYGENPYKILKTQTSVVCKLVLNFSVCVGGDLVCVRVILEKFLGFFFF